MKRVERRMRVFKTVTQKYYADLLVSPDDVVSDESIPVSAWRLVDDDVSKLDWYWRDEEAT